MRGRPTFSRSEWRQQQLARKARLMLRACLTPMPKWTHGGRAARNRGPNLDELCRLSGAEVRAARPTRGARARDGRDRQAAGDGRQLPRERTIATGADEVVGFPHPSRRSSA